MVNPKPKQPKQRLIIAISSSVVSIKASSLPERFPIRDFYMNSVRLAESLGYEYDHEYVAYEVANDLKTH